MRKYLYLIFCFFFFFSCSNYKKSEFEKGVELKYNKTCIDSSVCIVNIKEITNFKWDKMFVFKTTASLEIINEALGFDYPYFEDVAERIVFVKDNKIIYHDDYYPTFDDNVYTSLVFEIGSGLPYKSFNTDRAIFEIKKKEIENKQVYYVLSQKQN